MLTLIEACGLVRDALLIVLLYNTGMRVGEPLGAVAVTRLELLARE